MRLAIIDNICYNVFMNDLWTELKNTNKPIVLYGMGNGADKIISVLNAKGIKFDGIFSSDSFVRDKTFHGFKMESYSNLKEKYGDMVVLLCFGTKLLDVLDNINRIALEQELYSPDVPVYGNILFDKEYVQNHYKELEQVYANLADSVSKNTFENMVKYKLSGKLQHLYDCEVSENEPYESFLHLGNSENFIDLGAYRGDTVADFISRVNSYTHIYAVEPDLKTFKKLSENVKGIKNITLFNACAADKSGKIPFSMLGSRGASINDSGALTDSICVDDIIKEKSDIFIKMDIEGAETLSILGAENTIKNFKPKILISCYHKSEDLIEIPKAVLSIRKDYKMYMRHFKSVPAWDTCYYFV